MSYSPHHNPTKAEYENQSASLTRKLHFGEVPSFVQGHDLVKGRAEIRIQLRLSSKTHTKRPASSLQVLRCIHQRMPSEATELVNDFKNEISNLLPTVWIACFNF